MNCLRNDYGLRLGSLASGLMTWGQNAGESFQPLGIWNLRFRNSLARAVEQVIFYCHTGKCEPYPPVCRSTDQGDLRLQRLPDPSSRFRFSAKMREFSTQTNQSVFVNFPIVPKGFFSPRDMMQAIAAENTTIRVRRRS